MIRTKAAGLRNRGVMRLASLHQRNSSAINVVLLQLSQLCVREFADLIDKLFRRCAAIYKRRYYFLSRLFGARVPPHALSFLPHGLTVSKAGDTGIAVVDGFCTAAEARAVIDLARARLEPSRVIQNGKLVLATGRQSDTALVFGAENPDPALLPFACRAAALTGMPYTHLEAVYVTRYQEGGHYNEHVDYGDSYSVDRLYTVLLYLNDMSPDQGGATAFPQLNIQVQPRLGRAVSWTNLNPDRSPHRETSHAAMPVKAGGEKWTIQFWFHPHKMFDAIDFPPPQTAAGKPLDATAVLPEGVTYFERKHG
jgi:prolyl 4-hydroxylase